MEFVSLTRANHEPSKYPQGAYDQKKRQQHNDRDRRSPNVFVMCFVPEARSARTAITLVCGHRHWPSLSSSPSGAQPLPSLEFFLVPTPCLVNCTSASAKYSRQTTSHWGFNPLT